MKKLCLLLALLVSCGDSGNEDGLGKRNRGQGKCQFTTSGEDWREFVANVKELRFPAFSEQGACWENSYFTKLPSCDRDGIFYFCGCWDCQTNAPDGSVPCSSGALHEQTLINLVTPMPTNFEAEICDGKMVRAKIAIQGKGSQEDIYQFDFERPARFNPTWKQYWKSKNKYKVIVRQ